MRCSILYFTVTMVFFLGCVHDSKPDPFSKISILLESQEPYKRSLAYLSTNEGSYELQAETATLPGVRYILHPAADNQIICLKRNLMSPGWADSVPVDCGQWWALYDELRGMFLSLTMLDGDGPFSSGARSRFLGQDLLESKNKFMAISFYKKMGPPSQLEILIERSLDLTIADDRDFEGRAATRSFQKLELRTVELQVSLSKAGCNQASLSGELESTDCSIVEGIFDATATSQNVVDRILHEETQMAH